MKFAEGGSWLASALAILFAAWCTAWLWLLLEVTRDLPGVLTQQPGVGAFELLEIPTGRACSTVLFAVFLLCLLPVLLVNALRGVCDGKSCAQASLLWPLRARSFWLACLAWAVGGTGLALFAQGQRVVEWVPMLLSVLALWASPFLCANPSTLDAVAPSAWWRPAWPGTRALLICLLLWGIYLAASFVLAQLISINPGSFASSGLLLLDGLLCICVLIGSTAAWLNRGHWPRVQSDLWMIWRNGFPREFVWQGLVLAVIMLALAVPVLLNALAAIFLIPQYQQWSGVAGTPLPSLMRLQSQAYRATGTVLLVISVPVGLYALLVQARLMRQHGVGKGLKRGP